MSALIKQLFEDFNFIKKDENGDDVLDKEVLDAKIEKAAEMDEVETVTFGMETDDGQIVKVYVNAEQADNFEKALANKLGEEDVIETVLNDLSQEFDIIDVEWPGEGESQNDAESPDQEDADAETGAEDPLQTDGSESLNNLAWGDDASVEKDTDKSKIADDTDEVDVEDPENEDGEDEEADPEGLSDESIADLEGEESPTKKKKKASKEEGGEEDLSLDDLDGEEDAAEEEGAEDEESEDELDEFGEPKKKKKKKAKKDSEAKDEPLKQEQLSYGQRFTKRLLGERNLTGTVNDDTISEEKEEQSMKQKILEFAPKKNEKDSETKLANLDKSGKAADPRAMEGDYIYTKMRRPIEKMIYTAILELGVPSDVLSKATWRQQVVNNIRQKGMEIQRNAQKRQALAWFLSRYETAAMKEGMEEAIGEVLTEGPVEDVMGFMQHMLNHFDPTEDKALANKIMATPAWKQFETRAKTKAATRAPQTVRTRMSQLKNLMQQADKAKAPPQDLALESQLIERTHDDVLDMEADPDVAKADAVDMTKRPSHVAGLEVVWGMHKDSNGNVTLVADMDKKRVVSMKLDAEQAEALDKAFANHEAVTVRDAKSDHKQPVKFTFVPRGNRYIVRKKGEDKRNFLFTSKDIDGFQDQMMSK